jgi:predicted Zn-dependent peptidase
MTPAARRWGRAWAGPVLVALGVVAPGSLRAAPAAAPAASDTAAPDTAAPDTATPAVTPPNDEPTASDDAALIVDSVLPCGVRVIIAQDLTLPVAAIALAIETGTEDDPADAPGLVHALAYHLFQGNREYAPGGVARAVHGTGGVTSFAIGPAQLRYESVVPASMLADMITAEASRLRAPSVSETLWKDTLRWARRDRARTWSAPAALRASAHQAEGLRHDGHAVSESVVALSERAVSSQLAERLGYDRATLVIVAPDAPALVLNTVTLAFGDLPPAPRSARDRTVTPATGGAPRAVATKGAAPGTFVWPIPADTAGQAWADVVCGAMNRLRRATHEHARARVRCSIDDDARRGVMVVKVSGVDDAQATLRDRLTRVGSDDEAALSKERAVVAERLRYAVRTPLALARHLARARSPGRDPMAGPMRPAAELLGADAVLASPTVPTEFAHLLDLGAATIAAPAADPKPAGKTP